MKMDPSKKQILVVEDNQDLREFMIQTLVSEDYDIFTANDGDEAMVLIESHRLDLILLDIQMPGKSGMEVLAEIRSHKDSKIRKLLVVMITAKSLIDDINDALLAGADSYMAKPFRPVALRTKIKNLFDSRLN